VTIPPGLGDPPTGTARTFRYVVRSDNPHQLLRADSAVSSLPGSELLDTRDVVLGDFNGNGHIDVILAVSGGANRVFWNDGDGNFSTGPTIGGADDTRALVAVDLNHNGRLDLIEGVYNGPNNIWLNSGGAFTLHSTFGGSGDRTTSLSVADANRNGHLDILAGNHGQFNVLYYNDGSLGFAQTRGFGPGDDETTTVQLGDITGNGWPDVFLGNEAGDSLVYRQFLDGVFVQAWERVVPGLARSYLADLDQDGILDIAFVVPGNRWSYTGIKGGLPFGMATVTGMPRTWLLPQ
jgi:hypothetical protein